MEAMLSYCVKPVISSLHPTATVSVSIITIDGVMFNPFIGYRIISGKPIGVTEVLNSHLIVSVYSLYTVRSC